MDIGVMILFHSQHDHGGRPDTLIDLALPQPERTGYELAAIPARGG